MELFVASGLGASIFMCQSSDVNGPKRPAPPTYPPPTMEPVTLSSALMALDKPRDENDNSNKRPCLRCTWHLQRAACRRGAV
eukprot:scaffold56720_cov62-Phaeocystis_antarctica.AAC.1